MSQLRFSLPTTLLHLLLLLAASTLTAQQFDRKGDNEPLPPDVRLRTTQSGQDLLFTRNRGQVIDTRGHQRNDILYTVDSPGAALYLTGTRISHVYRRLEGDRITDHCTHHSEAHDDHQEHEHRLTLYRLDMELLGARPDAVIDADERSDSYTNYYYEHCPDGITQIPSFRRLVYREIYPNIDMVLRGVDGSIKSEFIVRPGGRVGDIRMRYVAADDVLLDSDGALRVTTPLGWLEENAPVTFQEIDGTTSEVSSRFIVHGDVVTFEIGAYDSSRVLVIDPQRKWSTYYGGSGTDNLNGGDPTEVDRGGNVLMTGWTTSNPFPTTTGNSQYSQNFGGGAVFGDAFVVKFDGTGRRLWATYYGGSGNEIAHGIASDVDKNVFITGHVDGGVLPTSSGAWQTSSAGSRDAFVVKFDSNGVRLWGTYYGGSNWDDGYGFGVDSTGNVAVLLTTATSGMQTSGMTPKPGGSSYDILLAKFNPGGSRVWATYIGGSGTEYGYAAASDIDDNIIFTGWTNSSDFPTTTGATQTSRGGGYDAFVVKFNTNGTMQWSTYYGGTGTEGDDAALVGFAGIATDGDKNIFITGHTSGGFPTTNGAFQGTFGGGNRDAFIVKFSPTGTLRWATYAGGNSEDVGVGCASSAVGSVLITGFTSSNNLPVTNDAYQATRAGAQDVFIIKVDSLGARQYVSYYGGTGTDEGHGISFDPDGAVAVAGNTQSNNFPTLFPFQNTLAGQFDAFAVVFCDASPPKVDSTGPLTFCWNDSVTLFARMGYYAYFWSTGALTHSIKIKESGKYWLRVTSASGCIAYSDTFEVKVLPKPDPFIVPGTLLKICEGDTIALDIGPRQFLRYRWNTGDTTRRLRVGRAGTYYAVIVDSAGCIDTTDIATVIVNPRPPAATVTIAPRDPAPFCEGDSVRLTATAASGLQLLWNTGARTPGIWAKTEGYYRVTVVNEFDCPAPGGVDSVYVSVYPRPKPAIIPLGPTTFCEGDSVVLTSSSGFVSYEWSTGDTARSITVRESGTYTLTVTDERGCVGSTFVEVLVSTSQRVKLLVLGSRTPCEGDSIVLDPGEGYLSYRWSTGDSTPTLVVRESGNYSVVLGDLFGCKAYSDTVSITFLPRPAIAINGPEVVCAHTSAEYSVPEGSGSKYEWTVTGAGGTIISGDGTSAITVQWGASGSGKVRVKVTSPTSSCFSIDELTVTISTTLVPRITPNRSLNLCEGDTVRLDAGSYQSYLWSTGETTRYIVVRTSGTFSVTVTQGSCSGTSNPVTVSVRPAPQPAISSTRMELCPGQTATLSIGSFSKYQWSTGERTATKAINAPGTYSCTVTDSRGCTGTATITIDTAEAPTPVITGPVEVCPGAEATYSVTPTQGSSYQWTITGGGAIASGQNTTTIIVRWSGAGSGVVRLQETTTSGCTGPSEPLIVTIRPAPGATITPEGKTLLCLGDSLLLTGPEGMSSYSWSTGGEERSILVREPGMYRLTVTDEEGCVGSDSIQVSVRELPSPFITPEGPITLCEGESVELTAAPGYVRYSWSNGATGRSIVVSEAGDYSVTAENEEGCRGVSEVVSVSVAPRPQQPTISYSGDTLICSPAFATYQWWFKGEKLDGATFRRHIATAPGEYMVSVTSVEGCSVQSEPFDFELAFSEIMIGEFEAVPGERLTIPIQLVSSRNLDFVGAQEYSITLRFNRWLLYPEGATPIGIEQNDDRVITITGSRGNSTEGAIGVLELTAALGDTLVTPLTIEKFTWTSGKVSVSTKDGSVSIRPKGGWKLYLPDNRLTLVPPRPNPALGLTELTYETIETGRTQLYLVNTLGERSATVVDVEIEPGRYTVLYDVTGIASGSYFLVLETPTGRAVQPLQIEH